MKRAKQPSMPEILVATPIDTVPISRILKVGSCTNLSCKSNLTYHIGCTPDNEVWMRVVSNDGGGYFSPEWVSFKAIQDALEKGRKPLTSYAIHGLFKGKSANSPGFLFAALYAEGLVERDIDNPRVYVCCDPAVFIAGVNQLMASDINIEVIHIPVGRKTAPPSKKPAPSKSTAKNLQPEAHKD